MAIAETTTLTETDLTTIHIHAHRLTGNFGFSHHDHEDIQQDLALDLLSKLHRFDPSRGKRSTFVKRCVRNRISKMIRDSGRQCRDHRRVSHLDGLASSVEKRHLTTRGAQVATELRLDVATALEALPEETRAVAALLPEHSPRAISQLLRRSKRRVYDEPQYW